MPIKKSAIKRVKQNITARDRNRALKKTFRLNVKNLLKTAKTDVKEATKMVPETYKSLDKAAKSGAIHKNTAARRKSRLIKKLNEFTTQEKSTKKETEEKKEKSNKK